MTPQEAVRLLRSKCNLSQQGLAKRLGVGVRTISRYETDSPPQGKMLRSFIELAMENQLPELGNVFFELAATEIEQIYGLRVVPPGELNWQVLREANPHLEGAGGHAQLLLERFVPLARDWSHLYRKGQWEYYADKRLAEQHDSDMTIFEEVLRSEKQQQKSSKTGKGKDDRES